MRHRSLLLVFPISLITSPALSQQSEETVVIRGEALLPEALPPEALPPEDKSTWSQSLDEDDLDMEASGRVESAVGDLGGIQFRRSDARSAHPTSQGLTLRGLGGNAASRVLVLLDGVPQADPFGGWVSWPGYDALPLSSVTLERGGGTGEHGAGALAGTLSLTTRELTDDVDFAGEFLAGSRTSIVSRARAAFPTGPVRHLVSASAETSDGFVPAAPEKRGPVDETAPYQQAGAFWRSKANLGQALNLSASGRGFIDRRTRGVPFTENENEGFDLSLQAASPETAHQKWSALVYFQSRKLASSFASVNDERTEARQVLDQVHVPSNGLGARLVFDSDVGRDMRLVWGADFRRTEGRSEEEYLFVEGAPSRERTAGGISETGGVFSSLSWRGIRRLTLSVSGRADFWHLHGGFRSERELNASLGSGGQALSEEDFANRSGVEGTGRLGVGFDAAKSVRLRGASYTGFRLPTLNELYRPFRAGSDATAANAKLDPERLWGTELGFEFRPFSGLLASFTAFENHLQGAIANVTLAEGPGAFDGVGFVAEGGAYRQRQNLSSIRSIGMDAALTFDERLLRLRGIEWGVLYSLVRSQVSGGEQAVELSGLVPAQVPTHSFSSTLSWSNSPDGTTLSTTVRYLGQQFEDDLNQVILNDAWTLDAAAKILLAKKIHALLRAENLTDARIEASKDSSGFTEIATPRTIWVGISYGK